MRLVARQELLRTLAHVGLELRRIDRDGLPGLRPREQRLGDPKPRHDSERRDDYAEDQHDPGETPAALTLQLPLCFD